MFEVSAVNDIYSYLQSGHSDGHAHLCSFLLSISFNFPVVCFIEDSKVSKRSHLCQSLPFSLQETSMLSWLHPKVGLLVHCFLGTGFDITAQAWIRAHSFLSFLSETSATFDVAAGQKRVLGPLELKRWAFVSFLMWVMLEVQSKLLVFWKGSKHSQPLRP